MKGFIGTKRLCWLGGRRRHGPLRVRTWNRKGDDFKILFLRPTDRASSRTIGKVSQDRTRELIRKRAAASSRFRKRSSCSERGTARLPMIVEVGKKQGIDNDRNEIKELYK